MTGRPRRVGWFDAVPLRYAVAVNSVSSIMLNKLDILSGHRDRPAVRRLRPRRPAGRGLAVERRRARARDADLRGLPGLERADPRHPLAGRPARERATLRVGDRGARRRADRARVGRPGADADDRTRLAPDAPPARACRHEPRDADPDPGRRRRRAGARARLEAGRRAGGQRGRRRAGQRRHRGGAAGVGAPDVAGVVDRRGRGSGPGARDASSSSSGRRRRSRPAWPTR